MAKKIPDLHETEFMDEVNKYLTIKDEIEALETAIAEGWRANAMSGHGDRITAAAHAYLDGTGAGDLTAPPSRNKELEAMTTRLAVLKAALAMQHVRQEETRRRVQDEASAEFRPEAERLLREIAGHLVKVGDLVRRAETVADPLKRTNMYSPRALPDCDLRQFRLTDTASAASRLLREVEYAYQITSNQ